MNSEAPFVVSIFGSCQSDERIFIGSGLIVTSTCVLTCRHVVSISKPFGDPHGEMFSDIWIQHPQGRFIRVDEIKSDASPDLALLKLECECKVTTPTFLQNVVPGTEARLRAGPLMAFGYTQDGDRPELWRYEISERMLLTSYRQAERTMTQMQLSGGLARGMSGGPVLFGQGDLWFYLATVYLGGERAATSRLCMADAAIEFLHKHGIREFSCIDATQALADQDQFRDQLAKEKANSATWPHQHARYEKNKSEQSVLAQSIQTMGRRPSGNLPANQQTFVGRKNEIEHLLQIITQSSTRLLTISGPGGVGKTTLALRLAEKLLERRCNEIWLIALAPIEDPELIWTAIAQAVDIQETSGNSLSSAVIAKLVDRSALLIFDNFEHLLDATDILSDILKQAPDVKIIATSRQRLDLAGEHEYPLTPLGLPAPPVGLLKPDACAGLANSEAIRLFVDRAKAAVPTFALTSANAADVASLCIQLDGLPLAIELAAARTKLLGPAAIGRRLAKGHELLCNTRRDIDERHRTLEAAIAWSFEMLPSAEATVFCNLSVFASWFNIEAASAVCAGLEREIEILEILSSLVDKSLLQNRTHTDGEPQFYMLKTINQFSSNKLYEIDPNNDVRDRSTIYFLERAEDVCQKYHDEDQNYDSNIIDFDYENILSILRRIANLPVDCNYAELRMCAAIWPYWERRGYFEDAYCRLQSALNRAPDAPASPRARALSGAGTMAWHRRDYDDAEALHRKSLAAFRSVDDVSGVAFATNNIGVQALEKDDLETAEVFFRDANELASSIDAKWLMSYATHNLGEIKYRQGDIDTALGYYSEGLKSAEAIGDDWLIAVQLSYIGEALADTERLDESADYLRRSLKLLADTGDFDRLAGCFERLAQLSARQDRFEFVVQWLAASDAVRTGPMRPSRQARYDQLQRIAVSNVEANKSQEIAKDIAAMSVSELVQASLDNTDVETIPARNH